MNKETFIEKLKTEDENIDMDWVLDVIKQSVQANLCDGNPRGHRNLIIVMEELAELTKELSKELRGKGDYNSLLEELADVQLSVYFVQDICGVSNEDLRKAMKIKMDRLNDVLQEEGKYN